MTSRLEDLLATARRQLDARSYDAAIDTCHTALGEPAAAESGVGQLLEAACRARDEARGIVRADDAPPAPPVEPPPADPPAPRRDPEPEPEQPYNDPQPEPPRSDPRDEPPPEPIPDGRPIEPPTFHLLDPEPFAERAEGAPPPLDVENLSILHPAAPPEEPELGLVPAARVLIALAIAIGVIVLAHYLK